MNGKEIGKATNKAMKAKPNRTAPHGLKVTTKKDPLLPPSDEALEEEPEEVDEEEDEEEDELELLEPKIFGSDNRVVLTGLSEDISDSTESSSSADKSRTGWFSS